MEPLPHSRHDLRVAHPVDGLGVHHADAVLVAVEPRSQFAFRFVRTEDQQRLDYSWNRLYNGQSDINYSKVPIGFECSARFKSGLLQITDIQREGVAFMEAMGSGINSFDVGV